MGLNPRSPPRVRLTVPASTRRNHSDGMSYSLDHKTPDRIFLSYLFTIYLPSCIHSKVTTIHKHPTPLFKHTMFHNQDMFFATILVPTPCSMFSAKQEICTVLMRIFMQHFTIPKQIIVYFTLPQLPALVFSVQLKTLCQPTKQPLYLMGSSLV